MITRFGWQCMILSHIIGAVIMILVIVNITTFWSAIIGGLVYVGVANLLILSHYLATDGFTHAEGYWFNPKRKEL